MRKGSTFAVRLAGLIDWSGRSNKEIAASIGYGGRQNLISMFRSGATKVPLAKLPDLARALKTDPGPMIRMALEDYVPELASAIESTFGLLSKEEMKLVSYYRQATAGTHTRGRESPFLADTFFTEYQVLLQRNL